MSRAKGLFITGTDTGVGKTRVTAILAVALRRCGLRVGVMKPVETGCLVATETSAHKGQYYLNNEGIQPGYAIHQGRHKAPSPHPPLPRPLRDGFPSPYDDRGGWATAPCGGLVGVGGEADVGRGPCADPGSPSTPYLSGIARKESDGLNPWAESSPTPTSHLPECVDDGLAPSLTLRPSSLTQPLHAQDSHFLRQISGCTALPEIVTPYMFREPLAPAIVAQHEGQEIDLNHIAYCYEKLAAEHDIVLVEGAGGLLVPLTRQENFLDLAARLDLPILVVARNILGTINHTALTVIVASQRCQVLGIILNTVIAEVQDASQASNAEALRIWGRASLLGMLPYVPEVTPESLLKQSESIDISAILG